MADEGKGGSGKKIERLVKGDHTRTLMHTDVGNQLIERVNRPLEVSPTGAGKFIESDANVVLQLFPGTDTFPDPEDTAKTYVWFAEFVDGAWDFSWKETTECP